MGSVLTAKMTAGFSGNYKLEFASSGGVSNFPLDAFNKTISLTNGTGEGQADIFWGSRGRALASGGNEDLDIFDGGAVDIGPGAGRDNLGQDLAVAEVVGLYIHNTADSVGSITIGAAASNPWTGLLGGTAPTIGPIPPNSVVFFATGAAAGWTVTDGSSHKLRAAASGGAVVYDIGIAARTA
jgi:hypothetical protein